MKTCEPTQRLRPREIVVVSPLLHVEVSRLDIVLRAQADSVVVELRSLSGAECPLEVVFGRGKFVDQVNIFVGMGAEFCNAESIATAGEAAELAQDIAQLASSRIALVEHRKSNGALRAMYTVAFPHRDPINLTYRGRATSQSEVGPEPRTYVPWIASYP